ncbi:MAG: metalloregulator ArsR/SmtB family transcription factor [Firmicutes bacterium]|nr:metalloregulator ArsR/SmtB family transcription factor [Bacillota bacterium]
MPQTQYLQLTEEAENNVIEFMPEHGVLDLLGSFFGLFSDATRIKIMCALSITPMCVNDISQVLGINQTTVSHQLKLLYDRKIVTKQRYGKILFYSIAYPQVAEILESGTNYLFGE